MGKGIVGKARFAPSVVARIGRLSFQVQHSLKVTENKRSVVVQNRVHGVRRHGTQYRQREQRRAYTQKMSLYAVCLLDGRISALQAARNAV